MEFVEVAGDAERKGIYGMITEVHQNIFDLPLHNRTEAICVTTNGNIKSDGRAVMGAGIAKAFKLKYPDIDIRLAKHLKSYGNTPCNLGIYDEVYVLSFPTKDNWKKNSNIKLIEQSAIKIKQLADELNLSKIYLPRPGCDNGHLNWKNVKPVLEEYLDERFIIVSL